eukprot:CAMPEP_0116143356 /NCGR_PEP_ID=MMETSP0329-20121206/15406_1 /TAXON_ID=697910 /ORGANISM="Pseudo-nitzschia arenysensis, Strain B593" /LENGTH=452 /DNA_ID=CAMNT_0003638669 /DNA_START=130 /DNA_END=1488 /DNA_ORIENTATION=+
MAKIKSATKGGSKRDKPPALDQYKKPLIVVALAMLAYQLFKGMMAKEIVRVDMTATANELELREVFFGEDASTGNTNYAVLCYPESAMYPISSVFQDAANDGSAPAEFRIMDCDVPMPGSEEGKTVIGRFKLSKKTRPVVFVSGAIGQPKQVPAKYLKTGAMLTKALKNLLEPKAEKIETTQDLRSKCLDKDTCALLLKGSKTSPNYVKEAVQKLVVEYPKVTFAAVDSSVLYLHGVEAEFLDELVPGMPRFVVFKKTSGSTDKKNTSAGRLKTTIVPLDVDVAYGPMSNLVASVVSGTTNMSKVSSTPTIKTRTKKLEKSENEKRQRRKNRASGGSPSSSSSDSGAFQSGENDGSAAGRRAERERRRAEHRAKNPNYREKTPEEIKEIERKRRIRMEEEASKWNIAPEDADPDGGEGADPEYVMEDWDEDEEQDLDADEEEEEDEDVMDLD